MVWFKIFWMFRIFLTSNFERRSVNLVHIVNFALLNQFKNRQTFKELSCILMPFSRTPLLPTSIHSSTFITIALSNFRFCLSFANCNQNFVFYNTIFIDLFANFPGAHRGTHWWPRRKLALPKLCSSQISGQILELRSFEVLPHKELLDALSRFLGLNIQFIHILT